MALKSLIPVATAFALLTPFVYGQDKPATPDLARGAVDPFDAGGQRAKFFRATGVDYELDADEFKAAAAVTGGFAQPFDRWEALVRFDKDGNGTLDWSEASAYREDLRGRFLAAYDADKNGKLNSAERDKANEALAAGRLPEPIKVATDGAPSVAAPADLAPGAAQAPQFQQLREEMTRKHDKDGDGELTGEERTAARAEVRQTMERQFVERFDTNGDGQLDDSERQQARESFRARREQRFQERFDADGDGQLSDAEKAEMETARERFRQRGEWRRRAVEEFDKDGDGELNEQEREAADKALRQRGDEWRRRAVEEFDKDGDGELNEQEREAARESYRRRAEAGELEPQ